MFGVAAFAIAAARASQVLEKARSSNTRSDHDDDDDSSSSSRRRRRYPPPLLGARRRTGTKTRTSLCRLGRHATNGRDACRECKIPRHGFDAAPAGGCRAACEAGRADKDLAPHSCLVVASIVIATTAIAIAAAAAATANCSVLKNKRPRGVFDDVHTLSGKIKIMYIYA
ncbi:hypothetical protein BDZ88DRAFT_435334 [Geranomyces variabilis]|nr:hypothetical protein BDZ88DRAFT_435334 [Geranomyces variabilis]